MQPATRLATLNFEQIVNAPVYTLWHAWTAPAARRLWAAPSSEVTVEILEAGTGVGRKEISVCKVSDNPDVVCECGWLELQKLKRSVNYEVLKSGAIILSTALVTVAFLEIEDQSQIAAAVQLSSLAADMEAEYKTGFAASLNNLREVSERTMVIDRKINLPRSVLWSAWVNAETLPLWWGPEGYSCKTKHIDFNTGGEWVFDMIAADGTIYPNHHLYWEVLQEERLGYTLLWGENGPKHADAWVTFEEFNGITTVNLGMVFSSRDEFNDAMAFGAKELGQQTLAKLERFCSVSR